MRKIVLFLILAVVAACSTADAHRMTGRASIYTVRENGTRTAGGVPFSDHKLTAAHHSLPFGTQVRVTRTDNEASVVVTITDRGPFCLRGLRRRPRRYNPHPRFVIDMSLAGAKALGYGMKQGHVPVKLEIVK